MPREVRPELKKAIALFYDGTGAPQITAKGAGEEAEEIERLARESQVPLCENAPLAELLSQIEVGDDIPESLYIAIAHIIAFAYQLKSATPELMPLNPLPKHPNKI